jgi:uncharacterized protein (DUF2062 family)
MPSDFMEHLERIWQTPGIVDRLWALGEFLRPLLPAYLLGSSILAAILAIAAYYISRWFIRTRKILQTRHPGLP